MLVKTITKKIANISFLLIGLAPMLFILYFYVERLAIHHRMENKLEQQLLQKIVIAECDVVWMDDNEIFVNDLMFDIHHSSLKNGFYTFTGLYDAEETRLMRQQEEKTGYNEKESKTLAQLIKWLQSSHRVNESETIVPPGNSNIFTFCAISFINRLFRKVATPPPRRITAYQC